MMPADFIRVVDEIMNDMGKVFNIRKIWDTFVPPCIKPIINNMKTMVIFK